MLCRYPYRQGHLSDSDQLTLEFAGVYRHYNACLMRTIIVGNPNPQQTCHAPSLRRRHACLPEHSETGATAGEVFTAHAQVMDANGFRNIRMNACGYSLGTTFAPTWMDWPMFYADNPAVIQPNMVYFLHMILFDSENSFAMTLGENISRNRKRFAKTKPARTRLVSCLIEQT